MVYVVCVHRYKVKLRQILKRRIIFFVSWNKGVKIKIKKKVKKNWPFKGRSRKGKIYVCVCVASCVCVCVCVVYVVLRTEYVLNEIKIKIRTKLKK